MKGDLIPKDSDAFTLAEQIGTGSFATVYKAIDKKTNSPIAIKSYRLRPGDRSHFTRAATEIAFLKLLRHPHIITYICSDVKKQYMYLGIEYSAHGSLTNYMEKKRLLPEQTVKVVMRQLLSAICYLHTMYIFHGDIKPENIIVTENKQPKIKLTDFGLAEVVMKNQSTQKRLGSFFYMSPEIHLGFHADYRSDLFSAGVVMYEIVYGEKPFPTKITKDEYINLLRKRVHIKYPETATGILTSDCLNLMKHLLNHDKEKRLTGVELLNHSYIKTEFVKDEQNHYFRAYQCFLSGVDFAQERKYGSAYIEVTEAILHLQIHLTEVKDVGLYRYISMKQNEFTKYCERILERIENDTTTGALEMQSDSERLRCLLQSSPDLVAAYDLCVVGEMYFLQNDQQRGNELIKNGLQILINKIPYEPEGLRKKLLGAKMTQWMNILEAGQGTSVTKNSENSVL